MVRSQSQIRSLRFSISMPHPMSVDASVACRRRSYRLSRHFECLLQVCAQFPWNRAKHLPLSSKNRLGRSAMTMKASGGLLLGLALGGLSAGPALAEEVEIEMHAISAEGVGDSLGVIHAYDSDNRSEEH